MRKLREVLRLRFELKLGYQQIGRSCSIGVGTVHKYLKRAEVLFRDLAIAHADGSLRSLLTGSRTGSTAVEGILSESPVMQDKPAPS